MNLAWKNDKDCKEKKPLAFFPSNHKKVGIK